MKVLSTLALKGVLEQLRLQDVDLHFDATQAILPRVARGEQADLLILTAEALEELRKKGQVGEIRALGSSGVGVAVRAGARKPDIGSVDAFIHALVNAQSVAHSKVGASGIYFSQLLKDLKLEDRLKKRVIVEKGPVGLAVARGEAELGIQQLCELAPVRGIDILGPLPAPLQRMTHFAAAIPVNSADPKGASRLIAILAEARAAMIEGGMTPTSSG